MADNCGLCKMCQGLLTPQLCPRCHSDRVKDIGGHPAHYGDFRVQCLNCGDVYRLVIDWDDIEFHQRILAKKAGK